MITKLKRYQKLISSLVIVGVLCVCAVWIYQLNDFQKAELVSTNGQSYEKAEVVAVTKDNLAEDGNRYGDQEVVVAVKSGSLKGKEVQAISPSGNLFGANCTVGMKVIILQSVNGENEVVTIYSQDRSFVICLFTVFFFLTVCLVGGKRGMKAILGLVLTFVSIFLIFFPSVYKGASPVLMAILIAVFSTLVTLVLVGGLSKKTVSAIIGTTVGVSIAGASALLFGKLAGINGYNVSEIETLSFVQQYCSIKIGELLFAGIIISSLGAVMDVGMSVSSTIQEIHETDNNLSRKQLFLSGIHVGRDMMGTMINTLILAFAGGSMITLLINYAYDLSLNQLLNSYNMGIEIMQGISGSLGVVLTVPVTALVSAALYKK